MIEDEKNMGHMISQPLGCKVGFLILNLARLRIANSIANLISLVPCLYINSSHSLLSY